jgi:hypothetical protein
MKFVSPILPEVGLKSPITITIRFIRGSSHPFLPLLLNEGPQENAASVGRNLIAPHGLSIAFLLNFYS